ncbi:MAG TPA: TylF/MycF/NovP-related O-methyltransferase [Elusimicrobiota bacterium]|nr:TylF/MycF/NovP-related O-methyltransferase [Elusimicrobiota bacterium]
MFLSVGAAERHCRHYFFYNAFRALKFNGIDGDYAEFGVSGANTFALADAERTRHGLEMKLWAFDSFRGLPAANGSKDEHPEWVEGSMATSLDAFHRKCARRGIERSSYETVVGFYEDSLSERDGRRFPSNLALAYVDCDLHSSTTAVLAFLAPRLKHGMIVAFDDYFCWSAGQLSGERKALLEFEAGARQWHFQPFIQYGWGGMSFVIEDRNLIPRSKDHAAA